MTIDTESSGETAGNQAVRQVSGPSRRPSGTSLGVAGRTEINCATSRSKCRNSKSPGEHLAQRNQLVQQGKVTGCVNPGAGFRAWAGASRGLGPGPTAVFRRSEKSPGRGLAKGLVSAETAAADVGGLEGSGHGIPPLPALPPPPTPPLGCKGEKKRVFTLSVTETIQHAPQGRRIFSLLGLIGDPIY